MAVSNDPNENQSRDHQYYQIAEPQPGRQQNVNTGEPALQYEGQEQGVERANIGYKPVVEETFGEKQDCFRVVRTSKRLEIPCTRNEYRKYKVRVPKQVSEQVPRRVEYTDYEIRERQEPYSVKRFETEYREEDQPYTVQVPKKVTRMVKVKKRVPKTVYVDIVVEEPREDTIMVPETRHRRVKVPYQKEVVDQKYRTVKESVPVTKFRTEFDTVAKTVYEDEWKTKVVPVTRLVHKEIPVYNVVRNEDCADCVQFDTYPARSHYAEAPVQVLPDSTYEDHLEPNVETYPPYVETLPEPAPTYQVAPQYEQQPVMNAHMIQERDQSPKVEPVQLRQNSDYVPVKQPAPLMNNPEPALDTDAPAAIMDTKAPEPDDEQKVERWVETQYSAPAEYDANNDGILDAREREVARQEGNLTVDRIAIVQNPEDAGGVVEDEIYSKAPQVRRKKKKKTGGRKRRRSRRY